MITVTVDNAAALAALQQINPAQIQSKLRGVVRRTLNDGKQEARSRIIARYTARSPLSLGRVRSKVAGLTGTLTFGGKRNQLKKFSINPRRRLNPAPKGGVHATVVHGQGGSLVRAFLIKSGAVMEREGRSRLPIKNIKTIALSGMAKAVSAQVVNKMNATLEKELNGL